MSIKVGSFKDETAKAFRGFTLQTSTRVSSQTPCRGEFTAPPDPQLNWTPSCPKVFTIAQIIVCNSKMLGAQASPISTTEIFSLLTSFTLILQKNSHRSFPKVCHYSFVLFCPGCQFTKIAKQYELKHFVLCFQICSLMVKLFQKRNKRPTCNNLLFIQNNVLH